MDMDQEKLPESKPWKKELTEWFKAILIAVILVVVIRSFVFSPFIVDGSSMEPNFESGERLIVNKLIYSIRSPKRGEVIVFHVPEEGRDFIKRVIAGPGDKVKVDGDKVYVNGELIPEDYIREEIDAAAEAGGTYNGTGDPIYNFPNDRITEDTVPAGKYFVMGDNRSNSKDSRMIGYIAKSEIVGRADVIFWPLNKIKLVEH
jgi:signal peptidase I